MDLRTLNLNSFIKVKFNDKGFQVLSDHHNKMCGMIKGWVKRDAEYFKNKCDVNGYNIQLWEFMHIFGSLTSQAQEQLFDMNIKISENDIL